MSKALKRFLEYATIETTSLPETDQVPSTDCQRNLARRLVRELEEMGLRDITLDEHCYVTATLPAHPATDSDRETPVIGWIAHMDTSPDVSGKNVRPQIVDYRGGEIVLPNGVIIPEDEALKNCIGHRIVTSDGTTLLGADDKAGIAAILTAIERLQTENIPHGTIRIGFTPDEEVGNGTKYFDIERFGAFCAYTVDGELPPEINGETFTAQAATLRITGREVHPGTAKNVMVNALRVASEIVARLPRNQAPETTEKKEPFVHPYSLAASVGEATVKMLLRGFHDSDLESMKRKIREAINAAQTLFPEAKIDCEFKEQYRNMKETLDQCPKILRKLEEAVRRSGLEPVWKPIRGGTDGSRLSEMGLPTPNIFTGGHHFHSPIEWLSVDCLEKTVETLVHLAIAWAEPE